VKMLSVPYRFLFPAIMAFCAIGIYTLSNNTFDLYCAAGFAVLGWALNKFGFEPAPLILGFILGPMMEENLRRALLMAKGNWTVFVTRPISAGLIAVSVLLIIAIAVPSIARGRAQLKD
jgi:putative tricarboxylic transport membrane protein